ncbi:MAG: formylmethanofuran--tetrahydromethanopterin N-formyltransferase [Candidatus Altiarchaeales archaeon]|nr:formylmethanofuran--tetrahydromethanopterin N-formyltransferase [Candidatus Altiarchaeales archaeon]
MKTPVEDTYCEAFDGLVARMLITAADEKRLKRAALDSTALACTVLGESEGGLERYVSGSETPDGREGALIQIWVNKTKDAKEKLEFELGRRIRQGILVVPTTTLFNALYSEEKLDMTYRVGNCGDGFERHVEYCGREMIEVPIMMGSFKIERKMGFEPGIMGGNLWLFCSNEKNALEILDKAEEAIKKVEGVVLTFREGCSAGSKAGGKYKHIGPSTNEPYCPMLRNIVENSQVPKGVETIPEIVINGLTVEAVREAMKKAIQAVDGMKGLVRISAGNYGGKLGRHRIYLKELF